MLDDNMLPVHVFTIFLSLAYTFFTYKKCRETLRCVMSAATLHNSYLVCHLITSFSLVFDLISCWFVQ